VGLPVMAASRSPDRLLFESTTSRHGRRLAAMTGGPTFSVLALRWGGVMNYSRSAKVNNA